MKPVISRRLTSVAELLEGHAYPVGTVRRWDTGDHIKMADGSWKPVADVAKRVEPSKASLKARLERGHIAEDPESQGNYHFDTAQALFHDDKDYLKASESFTKAAGHFTALADQYRTKSADAYVQSVKARQAGDEVAGDSHYAKFKGADTAADTAQKYADRASDYADISLNKHKEAGGTIPTPTPKKAPLEQDRLKSLEALLKRGGIEPGSSDHRELLARRRAGS